MMSCPLDAKLVLATIGVGSALFSESRRRAGCGRLGWAEPVMFTSSRVDGCARGRTVGWRAGRPCVRCVSVRARVLWPVVGRRVAEAEPRLSPAGGGTRGLSFWLPSVPFALSFRSSSVSCFSMFAQLWKH